MNDLAKLKNMNDAELEAFALEIEAMQPLNDRLYRGDVFAYKYDLFIWILLIFPFISPRMTYSIIVCIGAFFLSRHLAKRAFHNQFCVKEIVKSLIKTEHFDRKMLRKSAKKYLFRCLTVIFCSSCLANIVFNLGFIGGKGFAWWNALFAWIMKIILLLNNKNKKVVPYSYQAALEDYSLRFSNLYNAIIPKILRGIVLGSLLCLSYSILFIFSPFSMVGNDISEIENKAIEILFGLILMSFFGMFVIMSDIKSGIIFSYKQYLVAKKIEQHLNQPNNHTI
jgi:hypothetical protein